MKEIVWTIEKSRNKLNYPILVYYPDYDVYEVCTREIDIGCGCKIIVVQTNIKVRGK